MKSTFSDLLHVLERIDIDVVMGKIEFVVAQAAWADAMSSMGWTYDEYIDEIDRRWTYIDHERSRPIKHPVTD